MPASGAQVIQKPKTCTACPLYKKGRGFALGIGDPKKATALWLGEALGATEAQEGRPFCGGAGNYLVALGRQSEWLSALTKEEADESAGIPERLLLKHGIFLDNILRCQPPGNKYPKGADKYAAERCCRQYDPPLPNVRVIVTFGQNAFAPVSGQRKGTITLWQASVLPHRTTKLDALAQGSLWNPPPKLWTPPATLTPWTPLLERTLKPEPMGKPASVYHVPTLHPAALMRSPKPWPGVVHALERALLVRREGWAYPSVRRFILTSAASCSSVLTRLARASKPHLPVMCDIENINAPINCIAFSLDGITSYVLPIVHLSGEPYWTPAQQSTILGDLARFFSKAYVGFQHGMYDVGQIQQSIGPVPNWVADTCYLHACTYTGLPHKLAFIQATMTNLNATKQMVKVASGDDDDK